MASRRQGIYWLGTIPYYGFLPYLPPNAVWIIGQLERGDGGFLHWQILVAFGRKVSLKGVRDTFGSYHFELSRSEAANAYVTKELTRVDGTAFELGTRPAKANSKIDWEKIWADAKEGSIEDVPASVRVRSYRTLRSIRSDYDKPTGMERTATVYWGPTATGKSHRAWAEAGPEAYPKSSRSKFWDGYQGEEHVILDEFRGNIDISYLLTWLDHYPVRVEIKGSSKPLLARRFWFTSNLHPRDWYPDIDHLTYEALERRLDIVNVTERADLT